MEGVCASGAPGVPRLCVGQRELSLEQLPVATDHHQLGGVASADGRPAGFLRNRPGHRLVYHHRGDTVDDRAIADRVLAVSATVRAIVYASGDQVNNNIYKET